jgi:hypothetical protein
MGARGSKSSAPGGYGSLTRGGYRRVWDLAQRRYRPEHVVVWERLHERPVPPGHDVHHRDHDRLNNAPENLELLDVTAHAALHSGFVWKDGQWWKPCRVCKAFKPVGEAHWYVSSRFPGRSLYGQCRACRDLDAPRRARASARKWALVRA